MKVLIDVPADAAVRAHDLVQAAKPSPLITPPPELKSLTSFFGYLAVLGLEAYCKKSKK